MSAPFLVALGMLEIDAIDSHPERLPIAGTACSGSCLLSGVDRKTWAAEHDRGQQSAPGRSQVVPGDGEV